LSLIIELILGTAVDKTIAIIPRVIRISGRVNPRDFLCCFIFYLARVKNAASMVSAQMLIDCDGGMLNSAGRGLGSATDRLALKVKYH
jgi:hypothetical protein